jgi:hypothetical protein
LLEIDNNHTQLSERLEKMKASNQSLLNRFPEERVVNEIHKKLNQQKEQTKSKSLPLGVSLGVSLRSKIPFFLEDRLRGLAGASLPRGLLAATAVLLLSMPAYYSIRGVSRQPSQTQDGLTRLKGLDSHLTIYRKVGVSFEKLENDSAVKAHDLLQLSYLNLNSSYGAILSVDGRGEVTVHLSGASGLAQKLIAQKEVVLPTAFELDDAPLFDRFYFLVSDTPFSVNRVIESIRSAQGSAKENSIIHGLPAGIQQSSVLLRR